MKENRGGIKNIGIFLLAFIKTIGILFFILIIINFCRIVINKINSNNDVDNTDFTCFRDLNSPFYDDKGYKVLETYEQYKQCSDIEKEIYSQDKLKELFNGKEYSEEYFKEKNLVILSKKGNYITDYIEIKDLKFEEERLNVYINNKFIGSLAPEDTFLYVLEVPKEVTQINIIENYEQVISNKEKEFKNMTFVSIVIGLVVIGLFIILLYINVSKNAKKRL